MDKVYSIKQFALRINVSITTLRRWDKSGQFIAKRRPSGHRYYDESDVREILNLTPLDKRKTVVYCRVSSYGQKDDLASQVAAMETYCLSKGIAVDEWVEEIAGGMNFKRKKFLSLISGIYQGEINYLRVAHKDRLARFGFDLIQFIADENGCVIEVVNQESLSPQQEMVEDLLAIVHTFSCRLSGLRKYKKTLKQALSSE